jgi:hypothetical protein
VIESQLSIASVTTLSLRINALRNFVSATLTVKPLNIGVPWKWSKPWALGMVSRSKPAGPLPVAPRCHLPISAVW